MKRMLIFLSVGLTVFSLMMVGGVVKAAQVLTGSRCSCHKTSAIAASVLPTFAYGNTASFY